MLKENNQPYAVTLVKSFKRNKMYEYRVGELFPHKKYLGRGEITVAILNQAFLDVLICINGITEKEKKIFKKGKLEVSIFEKEKIPFIVFDLGSNFIFDVSVEIHKIGEFEDAWLNSDANAVNLFLVDALTGQLEAMRMIGLNERIAEKIRDICEQQTEIEPDIIAEKIRSIQEIISSADMIKSRLIGQQFVK